MKNFFVQGTMNPFDEWKEIVALPAAADRRGVDPTK
jgi:hypothetical protein